MSPESLRDRESDAVNGTSGVPPAGGPSQSKSTGAPTVESVFDGKVTTFASARTPKDFNHENTLREILHAIESGKFRDKVEELRRIRARDGDTAYDKAKVELPAFCVSGITEDRRTIRNHTGLIQLDFDKLGPVLALARQRLMSDPHIAAIFLSPSGDGLKAFLRVDGTRHDATFKAAQKHFLEHYELTVDPAVKQQARLCFVSFDPDLHRNEEAQVFAPSFTAADEHPEPAKRGPGRPRKEPPWWAIYKGDLSTLKLEEMFRKVGRLGNLHDADTGKHGVKCPWCEEHTDKGENWNEKASDTVIWMESAMPAFHCLHAHCQERSLKEVCAWFEAMEPGCVDKMCTEQRVWQAGQKDQDGRPLVILPSLDRPDDEFAAEVGKIIAPKESWFLKNGTVCRIGVRRISEKCDQLTFSPIEAIEARTLIAYDIRTGVINTDKATGDMVFSALTMTRECASGMLHAPQFKRTLPQVFRILDLPLPLKAEDGSTMRPNLSYDRRFKTFTDPKAPPINIKMTVGEAKQWLKKIHVGFGFADAQSVTHALARLITPYCRGLMGWDARFPLWHFHGNRPRAGKDYLAGIAQIVYEGRTIEDAPLERESEETRKRITAALMSGRRMVHFANCQGHIKDAVFIGSITSKLFAARNLGSTDAKSDLQLPNEIEFSLSANVGLTFRTDVEPRTRKISLKFGAEDANGRNFPINDLHGYVRQHRNEILSAIDTLVLDWIAAGKPVGETPFNSFPEWGTTVGGIMMHHGLGNPCLPHQKERGAISADHLTEAMRTLYVLGYSMHPDTWIEKSDIYSIIEATGENEAFSFFGDLTERRNKIRLGRHLHEFNGRELAEVTLKVDELSSKTERHRYMFTREIEQQGDFLSSVMGESTSSETTPAQPAEASEPGGIGGNGDVGPTSISDEENNSPSYSDGNIEEPVESVGRTSPIPPTSPKLCAELVTSRSLLPVIAEAVIAAQIVPADIETYGSKKGDGLSPFRGDIRLLSFKTGDKIWTLDLRVLGYDLGVLGTALEGAVMIAHNAKFEMLWLRVKCGLRISKVFCTQTASRLLTGGTWLKNDLGACLERHLNIPPSEDHAASDWGAMFLTDEQLEYAARDVNHLMELAAAQAAELGTNDLTKVKDLEMALLPHIVDMESNGFAVERYGLRAIQAGSRSEAQKLAAQINEAFRGPHVNPSSPPQLLAAFARNGITLEDTKALTLESNRTVQVNGVRVVPIIAAFREQEKMEQQATSLLNEVQLDGRIHGSFNPMGTVTGRFSSKEPNLQNINRDGALRGCFIAAADCKLVVADYSQIELRAAAQIAGETKMIKAFQDGADLHALTASVILNKPIDQVTKHDRQKAKSANFGLLYGQGARGLVDYAAVSYGVKLTLEEAETIYRLFFRTYGALRNWHGHSRRKAENKVKEIRTITGRRRLLPLENSDWERFTGLVNTPVQGGCADAMKYAIIEVGKKLPELCSGNQIARMISTVHDELIVEVSEELSEHACRMVQVTMQAEAAKLFTEVPIEVEAKVVSSWAGK